MLTTLLGMHTMARRHCEAARRQQARVTAGGPSFDRTRAGAEKFGPNQPPHRLHAPARSPPGHREVREGGCTGGPHSAAEACGVPRPTQYSMHKCEHVCIRIRTHVWWVKTKHYRFDQTIPGCFDMELKVVLTDRGSRSQPEGTVSTVRTQSTPHPRAKIIPAGRALASLGGSSATRPRS